jgi:hypothetical protein
MSGSAAKNGRIYTGSRVISRKIFRKNRVCAPGFDQPETEKRPRRPRYCNQTRFAFPEHPRAGSSILFPAAILIDFERGCLHARCF